jgi:hypothetical protein
LLQGVPQELEHTPWHVRVAHDVVLFAEQFGFSETRELDKDPVAVSDAPFEVGFGDDEVALAHHALMLCRFVLVFHVAWRI